MEVKQHIADNQSNPSLEAAVKVMAKEVETASPSLVQEKNADNTNGGVLQNEMKQELLDFVESSNVLSNRHKEFMGLCERLNSLGRKHSIYRLKELFYIDPEENENETDKDLDLDSMKDYVTFVENTKIKIEPALGMGNDGKIHTNWDFDDKPFVAINFQGNQKTKCGYKLNGEWHSLNSKLSEVNNKLTDLKVI